MEENNAKLLKTALQLDREVVGVHFLPYRAEYENSSLVESEKKGSFCSFVNRATRGEAIKVNGKHFTCQGGASSVGVAEEPDYRKDGRLYEHCGLYRSHAAARLVTESMCHIPHKIYGLEIGPADQLEDIDIVIVIATAKQMMRLIQGYTFEYGPARNLSTVGNQAACSDLCAKPFMNNDLNLTLMCCGMRISTQAEDGEMGAGFPIQMLSKIVNGVIQTLNLTEPNSYKENLKSKLKNPSELGIEIRLNDNYGLHARNYEKAALEMALAESDVNER